MLAGSSSCVRFCADEPAYVASKEVAALGRWAEESAAREDVTLPAALDVAPVLDCWACCVERYWIGLARYVNCDCRVSEICAGH